jgi:hypothetical protein
VNVKITYSSESAEVIRLFHGTDFESAQSIQTYGVSWEQAKQYGGEGHFWTTAKTEDARVFAISNPAGGTPALLSFDLPTGTIIDCFEMSPVGAYLYYYESDETAFEGDPASSDAVVFTRYGFAVLNSSLSNVLVEVVG